MDIALLEHFLVIAENQSFTKAADILDKSESVLSRQMSRLEEETGITLFNRSNRRITLTPAAKVFCSGAAEVVRRYYQAVDDALAIHNGSSGNIRLGIFENHLLPDSVMNLLQDFQERFPKISVQLEPLDVFALRQNLADGELDMFYSATNAFQDDPTLSFLSCGRCKNYLLFSKMHPAALHDPATLRLSDFKNDRFIIRENSAVLVHSFTETCARSGFVPQFTCVKNQTQMLTSVLMNAGVLIINGTHFFVKSSDTVALPLPELTALDFGFFYHRDHVSSSSRTLLDYLAQHPVT